MTVSALVDKSRFMGLDDWVWLYTGAESPPLRDHLDAFEHYLKSRAGGPHGRTQNEELEARCKQRVAQLIGGESNSVSFLANSSHIIASIARALPFNPGDNVIIHDLEFPSGVLPWLVLRNKGLEVRVIKHNHWQITAEDVLDKVDERTRMVCVSHVGFLSGARIDYQTLYRKLVSTNTLLLLDATQSLGVVPVNVAFTDFLVSSSYKWLLSTHGLGILAVNPSRTSDLVPSLIGWRSVSDPFGTDRFQTYNLYQDVRKFDLGYPSYPTLYTLATAIELLLKVGITNIENHVLKLGEMMVGGLKELGLSVMTPDVPCQRAGNIAFSEAVPEHVAEYLDARGILVYGGQGRVRSSVHLFNDEADVSRYLGELASYYKR